MLGFLKSLLFSSDRTASPAAEGAVRQAVLGAILGTVVGTLTQSGMDPAQVEQVRVGLETALGAMILGGGALLGKILRNWMIAKGGWVGVLARFIPLG